jgi:DNA polymerase I-like protein with 3'-5' exonuclease and polymerase domains
VSTTNGFLPRTAPEAARYHLARGELSVPVPPRTKKCVEPDWSSLRITEGNIDHLFQPNGNIGLLLGEPSGGLVDIDLDCPEAIAAAPHLLPETDRVSGRESAPQSHYWYATDHPPDKAGDEYLDPIARSGARTCLVELRSTGGMTVIPPSIYPAEPEKGHPRPERCVWHGHGQPTQVTITELREAVGEVASAALLARHWPAGARHDVSLALAGGLLRAEWKVVRVEQFVRAICVAAGDHEVNDRLSAIRDTNTRIANGETTTGWPTLEGLLGQHGRAIVTCVRSWLAIRPNQKSESSTGTPARYVAIPEYLPFPTDCLPAPWDAFVSEGAAALRCDEALVALPLLAVLASAIGNTRRIHLGAEWYEPAVLWTCVVAESGGRKSPAAELGVERVKARQKRLVKEFKEALKEYKRQAAEHKARKRDDGDDEASDAPEKPTLKRVLVSDVTVEKLAGLLDDNRRGLLVYRDELAGWVGSFTRYKGKGGGSDEPNWLSIHRGDALIYDRKTGDKTSVFVPHATVSVCGGIQPGVLKRLASQDLFDSGLVARLIFAMPPRTPKTWSDDQISAATKAAADRSLAALYELSGELDEDGDLCPIVIELTTEARNRLKGFVNEWGLRQFDAEGEMAAALAKLEALPGRFALIHHTVLRAGTLEDTDPIGLDSLEEGIRLAAWCAHEADRVYALVHESAEDKDTRKLVDLVARLAVRNKGRVTVKILQRANQKKYLTADLARADLEHLVGLGLGRWEEAPANAKGGWRPTYFIPTSRSGVTGDSSYSRSTEPDNEADSGEGDCEPDPPDNGPGPASGGPSPGAYGSSTCDTSTSDCEEREYEESPVTPEREVAGGGERVESVQSGERHPTGGPRVIQASGALSEVVAAVRGAGRVGLDIETTGLSHANDRPRLLSLATPVGTFLIDLFRVDPALLWPVLAGVEVVGHNLGFDLPFLMKLGFVPGRVRDTMLASQVLHAGDRTIGHSLKELAQRHLGLNLDKELQTADWSGPLTQAHLEYAARDAELPLALWDKLLPELTSANLTATVETEMAALPAVAWAGFHGIGFDRTAWETLATETETTARCLRNQLDAAAPNPANLFSVTNWNSPEEAKTAFAALGIALEATDDDSLAAIAHPVAGQLREYRAATKLAGTYGREWLRHVSSDGRVYATWKQIGAGASGRMSCKEPNLQQLPRDVRFRRCFIAPPGRVLVKADYSQIELRIAAKIANDRRMLDAYHRGEDLHTLTARAVTGRAEVTKTDRQLAKSLNFGLLYGMGAKSLAAYAASNFGVTLSDLEAAQHRETFFRTYPGLRAWHNNVKKGAVETRTLDGRRRLGVTAFTEKLNTPVQGSGADGLKRALALLWERRAACPDAFPVLLVHDEIVVECDETKQNEAMVWVRDAMRDGMSPLIDPVPVEVEVTAGKTWGG